MNTQQGWCGYCLSKWSEEWLLSQRDLSQLSFYLSFLGWGWSWESLPYLLTATYTPNPGQRSQGHSVSYADDCSKMRSLPSKDTWTHISFFCFLLLRHHVSKFTCFFEKHYLTSLWANGALERDISPPGVCSWMCHKFHRQLPNRIPKTVKHWQRLEKEHSSRSSCSG